MSPTGWNTWEWPYVVIRMNQYKKHSKFTEWPKELALQIIVMYRCQSINIRDYLWMYLPCIVYFRIILFLLTCSYIYLKSVCLNSWYYTDWQKKIVSWKSKEMFLRNCSIEIWILYIIIWWGTSVSPICWNTWE